MSLTVLLDPVRVLVGSGQDVIHNGAALLVDGELVALGEEARSQGATQAVPVQSAADQLLAPCLVDPHSVLEEPFCEHHENLASLRHAAARAGYGQVALLPRAKAWRDRVERLHGFSSDANDDVRIHLWGALTLDGAGDQPGQMDRLATLAGHQVRKMRLVPKELRADAFDHGGHVLLRWGGRQPQSCSDAIAAPSAIARNLAWTTDGQTPLRPA